MKIKDFLMHRLMSGSPADSQLASEALALLDRHPRPRRTHESAGRLGRRVKPQGRRLRDTVPLSLHESAARRQPQAVDRAAQVNQLVAYLRQGLYETGAAKMASMGRPMD